MEKYEIQVTQRAIGYYIGKITIEAKSKEEAFKILDSYTSEEVEKLTDNWRSGDETWADGEITYIKDSIRKI